MIEDSSISGLEDLKYVGGETLGSSPKKYPPKVKKVQGCKKQCTEVPMVLRKVKKNVGSLEKY